MRPPLLALLLLAIPLATGCSVYARDGYAADVYGGYGYSTTVVVPPPVYYGGYRSYGPRYHRGFHRGAPAYRAHRYPGHRASRPPTPRSFGRHPGHPHR
jgi:hypothetical protein